MNTLKVSIKKLSPDAHLPTYASKGSSGVDLHSIINTEIEPRGFALIPTGIAIEMPEGFEAQIRPRSGMALNHGVTVLNTPGTIDADYRGEIKVILVNMSDSSFGIKKGMKIAQMVFARVEQVLFDIVSELGSTERGDGGFGHSD